MVGDAKAESSIRKDLQKANQELKSLNHCAKVSGWLTYLSLPAPVFDLYLHVPIGTLLTAVSLAYQIKSDAIKKRNSWLLLGNRLG
jgi:hypothetical protein